MVRLTHIFALVSLLAPGIGLAASAATLEVSSNRAPKVMQRLDGRAVFIVLDAPYDRVEAAVARAQRPDMTLEVAPLDGGRAQVTAWAEGEVQAVARHASGRARVELTALTPREALVNTLKRTMPRGVPTRFAPEQLAQGEERFAVGDLAAARRLFTSLESQPSVAHWVRLRRADVQLAAGDTVGACADYAVLRDEQPTELAGIVARFRLLAAACPGALALEWRTVFSWARRLSPPVRAYLIELGAETMGRYAELERQAELSTVRSDLRAYLPRERRAVERGLERLLMRAVYAANAYDAAVTCTAERERIRANPNGAEIMLACAEVFTRLGTPDPAFASLNAMPRAARRFDVRAGSARTAWVRYDAALLSGRRLEINRARTQLERMGVALASPETTSNTMELVARVEGLRARLEQVKSVMEEKL